MFCLQEKSINENPAKSTLYRAKKMLRINKCKLFHLTFIFNILCLIFNNISLTEMYRTLF